MIAAALMIAGTAMQIWGQQQAANARAKAARLQADLDNMQANEVLDRAKFNKAALLRQEAMLQGEQLTGYARAGVDVGSGSPVLVMAQSIAQSRREIYLMEREAQFRAMMIRAGARAQLDLAKDMQSASQIQSAGTMILSGYNYASASGMLDKNDNRITALSDTDYSNNTGTRQQGGMGQYIRGNI